MASSLSLYGEILSDEVFITAADRFSKLAFREEATAEHPVRYLKSSTSLAYSDSMESRDSRAALDLAFSCLRYQKHLEELLMESGFFSHAPLPDEYNSLVLVMLWEFLQRKFIARGTRSKSQLGDRIENVHEVEMHLEKFAIKLAACLARMRIRESALTLGDTLSTELKNQEKIRQAVPVYAWANGAHSDCNLIPAQLEAMNIDFDKCEGLKEGLFQFDSEFLNPLEISSLVKSGKLLIVDSTTPLGPLAVSNLLNAEESSDVLHAGGTLSSIPILADFVTRAGKRLDEEAERQKYLFGASDDTPDIRRPKLLICVPKRKHEEFRAHLERLHVPQENIHLLPPLTTLEPNDPRLSQVKISLVEPKCSLSAAADPLQFLLMEGIEDDDARLSTLAAGVPAPQEGLKAVVAASLKLPRSAATVYITRSNLAKENEEVVQYALSTLPPKTGFKLSPIPLKLPIEIAESTYSYLRMEPNEHGSGLFMATITQNIRDPKDILRKQALKGLTIPKKSSDILPTSSFSKTNTSSKGRR